MKLHVLTLALAASAVGLTGCVSPNGRPDYTGTGALEGGAIGAVSGAAIGGRHAGEGALIGAAAGMIAGGLIGHSMDQQQQEQLRRQAPQTYVRVDQGQPLGVADVKALAKAGISEDVIISQIQNSRTVYHLSAADIIDLRDAGVTDKVVNYMINTPSTAGAAAPASTMVVQQAPPPPPAETVVVAAPGPGYVWIGGDYDWNGISWVWIGGHWAYPPYPYAVWISGRVWHDRYGWHHARGYWR
ncbi:MAG: YXWGXW repeat-containing protein [Limisphaerales bacterium]